MGLFGNKEFQSLEDLYVDQLQDIYDAEKRLLQALPKMVDAAGSKELKSAFDEHLKETGEQASRLETIFKDLNQEPKRETCDAMKGLIKEAEEMVEAKGPESVKDAALIAAAQRIKHYEIAGYGTARNFARRLGHERTAEILQETLNEEGEADDKLTELAEQMVNPEAAKT